MTSVHYSHYGKPEFWSDYYSREITQSFDWLLPASSIIPLLRSTLRDLSSIRSAKVLEVGCGISDSLLTLHEAGWTDLTGIDLDPSPIIFQTNRLTTPQQFNASTAQQLNASTAQQLNSSISEPISGIRSPNYVKMDILSHNLPLGSFTHILDKALLDSLLSGYSSHKTCSRYLSIIHSLLGPKGTFLLISTGPPSTRMPLLSPFSWTVKHSKIAGVSPLQNKYHLDNLLFDRRALEHNSSEFLAELDKNLTPVDVKAMDTNRPVYAYFCTKESD